MDASTLWAAIGALGTLATAGIAALAASQSRHSTEQANAAAASASQAAEALAAIERGRRHDELKPGFDIICNRQDREHAELRIELTGGTLEYMDEAVRAAISHNASRSGAVNFSSGVTRESSQRRRSLGRVRSAASFPPPNHTGPPSRAASPGSATAYPVTSAGLRVSAACGPVPRRHRGGRRTPGRWMLQLQRC